MIAVAKVCVAVVATKDGSRKGEDSQKSNRGRPIENRINNSSDMVGNSNSDTSGENSSTKTITVKVKSKGNGHTLHVIRLGIDEIKIDSATFCHLRLDHATPIRASRKHSK